MNQDIKQLIEDAVFNATSNKLDIEYNLITENELSNLL